jgi:hypothetical protein
MFLAIFLAAIHYPYFHGDGSSVIIVVTQTLRVPEQVVSHIGTRSTKT